MVEKLRVPSISVCFHSAKPDTSSSTKEWPSPLTYQPSNSFVTRESNDES